MKKKLVFGLAIIVSASMAMMIGCKGDQGPMGLSAKELTGIIKGAANLEGATDHSGILISIKGKSNLAQTDSIGSYQLSYVEPGPCTVIATKDGYVSAQAVVEVEAGKTTEVTDMTLARKLGTVAGWAFLEGNITHSGIQVKIEGSTLLASTNYKGFYQISNVIPGTYNIVATKTDYVSVKREQVVVEGGKTTEMPDMVLAYGPDNYEPDDTKLEATVFPADGTAQSHNLFADSDWFLFTAVSGHEYTITTFNLGQKADTTLALYDTDGVTELEYNDDGYKMAPASQIIWLCPADGDYYFKVDAFAGRYGANTEYDINVTDIIPPVEILLSELGDGPEYRVDSLVIDEECGENDLCGLGNILRGIGIENIISLTDMIAGLGFGSFDMFLASLGPTTSTGISEIRLAQVMGVADWANDPDWGGLSQFYVNPGSVDPNTNLVKLAMRGENYYESNIIAAATGGPMYFTINALGMEINLIPPLYDVSLSATLSTSTVGNAVVENIVGGQIKGFYKVADLIDTVKQLNDLLASLEFPPIAPVVGAPTVDRDGDGFPESCRARISFTTSQDPNLNPMLPPVWEVSLSISMATISADDVEGKGPITITACITADDALPPGPDSRVVGFEVVYSPDPEVVPTIQPTAALTDANAIATTFISGLPTKAGPVIVRANLPVATGSDTITILAGVQTENIALSPWNKLTNSFIPAGESGVALDVCATTADVTVLLSYADQFGNPISASGISGETIHFAMELPLSSVPGPDTCIDSYCHLDAVTDDGGMVSISIIASGVTVGSVGEISASWEDTLYLGYTLARVGIPHLACFLGEPAYRANTLQIDSELVRCETPSCDNCLEDRTCNSLGGMTSGLVNEILQDTLDKGDANITFVYQGLTPDNWDSGTINCAAINGLCGVPNAPSDCSGGEIEFFIDPAYYGPNTDNPGLGEKDLRLVFYGVSVTNGYIEVDVGNLSLPFPTTGGSVDMVFCNLVVSGTVTTDFSMTVGGLMTGAIPEASMEDLVNAMMPGMWEMAKGLIGEPDTECGEPAEPAYSVRLLSTAIRVYLYEVPPQ